MATKKKDPALTVAGKAVTLSKPASVADRLDVTYAVAQGMSHLRVAGCALAMCWPRVRRHLQEKGTEYRGDVAAYGGAAIDALVSEGALIREIFQAGQAALVLCSDDLPGRELDPEVVEALGNSEAP